MRQAQQAQQHAQEQAPLSPLLPAEPASKRPVWATRTLWLAWIVYGLSLAAIALWPTHIDAPASGLINAITRAIPSLTYARIEFSANVVLFVPFGALAVLLPRVRWWHAVVAALAFSTTAELLQMLATDRTSSVQDVVANTMGAAIGILAVVLITANKSKPQGRPIP